MAFLEAKVEKAVGWGVWVENSHLVFPCKMMVAGLPWPLGRAKDTAASETEYSAPFSQVSWCYTSSLLPIGNLGWQTGCLSGSFWQRKKGGLL